MDKLNTPIDFKCYSCGQKFIVFDENGKRDASGTFFWRQYSISMIYDCPHCKHKNEFKYVIERQ